MTYHHLGRKFAVLAFGVIALMAISPLSAFAQTAPPPPIFFCLGGIPGQPCPSGNVVQPIALPPPIFSCLGGIPGQPCPSGNVVQPIAPSMTGIPEAKKRLAIVATELFKGGLEFASRGVRGCPLKDGGQCRQIFAAIGLSIATLGTLLIEFALTDPPDSNFQVLVHPVLSPARHITAGQGITRKEADAGNALDDNLLHASILVNALITSINRAQGAHLAGNSMWEAKQLQAAKQFARQAAALLRDEPRLFSNVQGAFKGTKLSSLLIGGRARFPQVLTNSLFTDAILQSAQVLEQFASRGVVHVVNNRSVKPVVMHAHVNGRSVKHTVVHAHKNR